MKALENSTVVITGALGGLGRRVCAVAEAQGARVLRLDIARDESLTNSYAVDLTNADATFELIQSLGPFDGLINLAGGFAMGTEKLGFERRPMGSYVQSECFHYAQCRQGGGACATRAAGGQYRQCWRLWGARRAGLDGRLLCIKKRGDASH